MLLIGLLSVVFVGLVVMGSLRIRFAFASHSLRIRSAKQKLFFHYSYLCSYSSPPNHELSDQKYTYEQITFFCPLQGGEQIFLIYGKTKKENGKKIIINKKI